ncbi:MAG: sulfatase-like hydrolase/transferase [bacterium]|nr:sulfatase-like hydrolase/transferase [bacterium]
MLLTFSALRTDYVGALGAEDSWTPHIDTFAAEADWVGTAVAPTSAPASSLVSLMTGASPWRHQVLSQKPALPRPGMPLLQQALETAGYHCQARVPIAYDLQRFGLLEGFDDVAEIEPASETSRELEGLGRERVFYWLHLREANVAYQRRDAALPRLRERSAGLPPQIENWRVLAYADPDTPLPEAEETALRELFGHEVAWADHQAGKLLDGLRASAGWDDLLVIVTATQGTEIGEHGQVLYGQNLGRESIEVPLMIKLPRGLDRDLAVDTGGRVGLTRLWSTLGDAVGLRPTPAQAPSLLRVGEQPILSELYLRNGTNQFSLLDGDLQLLWSTRFAPAEPEFYLAQLAASGGRPPLSEPARVVLDRLDRAFRRTPPLSGPAGAGPAGAGPVGAEPPELRLERWTRDGVTRVENPDRARQMAGELRRRWLLFIDREQSPEEEWALSLPAR